MISSLGHFWSLSANGMELVHTILSSRDRLSFSMALSEKIPWVTIAMTFWAPLSIKMSAALQRVPQVSAISSISMHTLSLTSPTSTIRDTSLARCLSLCIKANSTSSLSAIEATLFAPPASGETITKSSLLYFSLMYRNTNGSAYKLSTGTRKKPWIWDAWRSMVMTWLHPAVWSKLAISLAVIGARDRSFLSCSAYGKFGITAVILSALEVRKAFIITIISMR